MTEATFSTDTAAKASGDGLESLTERRPLLTPIFEAVYSYQSFYGIRTRRLGLFDNPESALSCLAEESHLSDGEIYAVEYTFGLGQAGARAINESKRMIYGERLSLDGQTLERGWLDLREVNGDPDYLRMLELREAFAPFLMWRERFEASSEQQRAQWTGIPTVVRYYDARGERDPINGVGGSQSFGRFDSVEQAIEMVQGKGIGGTHGHVVLTEVFDLSSDSLQEVRKTIWGSRKNLMGPGYEYGYCDYRDYYEREEWLEFIKLSARYANS